MARRGRSLGLSLGVAACLAAIVVAEVWTHPVDRAAYAVGFAPRGDRVAAVGGGELKGKGHLWVWDVATGRQIASATGSDRLLYVVSDPAKPGLKNARSSPCEAVVVVDPGQATDPCRAKFTNADVAG